MSSKKARRNSLLDVFTELERKLEIAPEDEAVIAQVMEESMEPDAVNQKKATKSSASSTKDQEEKNLDTVDQLKEHITDDPPSTPEENETENTVSDEDNPEIIPMVESDQQVQQEETKQEKDFGYDVMTHLSNILKPKASFLDTHTRQTLFVRNDIAQQLDELSKRAGKGFKTKFINLALELALKAAKDRGLI